MPLLPSAVGGRGTHSPVGGGLEAELLHCVFYSSSWTAVKQLENLQSEPFLAGPNRTGPIRIQAEAEASNDRRRKHGDGRGPRSCNLLASLRRFSGLSLGGFSESSSFQTTIPGLSPGFLWDVWNILARDVKHSLWKVHSEVQPGWLVLMNPFASSGQEKDPMLMFPLVNLTWRNQFLETLPSRVNT